MPESPSFLPAMLNLDGQWEDILERLYEVFARDFKRAKTFHRGLRVIYNSAIKPDGQSKEEGFWHVVSKDDQDTGERLIDYPRAKRLPWAKPLMESPERSEIKVWQYQEGTSDKGIRTYIWLPEYDYILILQRKKNLLFWITAYYLESERARQGLQKKYEKRV